MSRFWNRTETSNCKYHISGSTYPIKFQIKLLESIAIYLKLFCRRLFQILQLYLSQTVINRNWSRFLDSTIVSSYDFCNPQTTTAMMVILVVRERSWGLLLSKIFSWFLIIQEQRYKLIKTRYSRKAE